MACTSPKTVSFNRHGKITFTQKDWERQFATFQLPCGKCLACRLDYAKQWAIRCVHEAQMYENNIFLTLTYDDEHLPGPKLVYSDFQKFMKKLRKTQNEPIGMFVTGEYGDKNKRPHWHAIVFNFRPKDEKRLRSNELGDSIFHSESLEKIWGLGKIEYGAVTLRSAGYCARYAAKKLVHGNDGQHEFNPISKKSSKHAIGRKWLEKYYDTDCFNHGRLILADGSESPIPRYYERWFRKNHPDKWLRYVTGKKIDRTTEAQERADKDKEEWLNRFHERRDRGADRPNTSLEVKKYIQEQKFKQLQEKLKL